MTLDETVARAAADARELVAARSFHLGAVVGVPLDEIVGRIMADRDPDYLSALLLSLAFIACTAIYAPRGDEQGPPDREVATENLRRLLAHLEAKGVTF